MLFSKFNNRPPFDRKKPTESYEIADKIKSHQESCCKNCNKPRIITEEEPNMPNKSNKNSGIPRLTKPDLKIPVDTASIQTLYRNTNACKIGRNLPKHKLMKKLLQNFDSDGNDSRKSFIGARKKKFFGQQEVVRTDFNVNCENKRNAYCKVEPIKNKSKTPQKVDQQTSTTGLPMSSKIMSNCCNYCKSKMITSNVIIEEPEVSRCESYRLPPIKSQKSLRSEQNTFRNSRKVSKRLAIVNSEYSAVNCKFEKNIKQSKTVNNTQNPLKNFKDSNREKTFVQIQVERLDKELKLNSKPPTYNTNIGSRKNINNNKNKLNKKMDKEVKSTQNRQNKSETSAYLDLMNKIKNECPQLHRHSHNPVKSDDAGWSDYSGPDECVKFPKETRTAMDQHLYEKRPLSKFTKVQHCRPAMNIINDNRCFNDSCRDPVTKPLPQCDREKYRMNHKSKILVPCKKNLLCDKGEYHMGTCGYTHCNRNKLIY